MASVQCSSSDILKNDVSIQETQDDVEQICEKCEFYETLPQCEYCVFHRCKANAKDSFRCFSKKKNK